MIDYLLLIQDNSNIFVWFLIIKITYNKMIQRNSFPVMVYDLDNTLYSQFKNIQVERWNKIGYKPIFLILCNEGEHTIHYPNYITKKIKYIENENKWLQCHAARLYSYMFFKNWNYKILLSDIDMLPLAKWYYDGIFNNTLPNQMCINGGIPYKGYDKINICYTCAYTQDGINIFGYKDMSFVDFYYHLKELYQSEWHSDELFLTERVNINKDKVKIYKRDYGVIGRLDREEWKLCHTRIYVDVHCPRPYLKHKKQIHDFLNEYDMKVSSLNV